MIFPEGIGRWEREGGGRERSRRIVCLPLLGGKNCCPNHNMLRNSFTDESTFSERGREGVKEG